MKVREVVALAAANIGREELAAEAASFSGTPTGDLAALVRCYNLIENEIALDYFPLKAREETEIEGGKIPFSALSRAPVRILRVTVGGRDLPFTLGENEIFAEGRGKALVVYAYSPAEKKIEDDGSLGGKISVRLMAAGVACEFFLSHGNFAEAQMWDNRFREGLAAADLTRRRLSIRSRRWV